MTPEDIRELFELRHAVETGSPKTAARIAKLFAERADLLAACELSLNAIERAKQ